MDPKSPTNQLTEAMLRRLEESVADSAWSTALWSTLWGTTRRPPWPNVIDPLLSAILEGSGSVTALIHGRYGTGKSCFLKMVRQALRSPEPPPEGGTSSSHDRPEILTVWLHMPTLAATPSPGAMPLIYERLTHTVLSHLQPQGSSGEKLRHGMRQAMADLWTVRTGGLVEGSPRSPRPAEPWSGDDAAFRFSGAHRLEELIQEALEAIERKQNRRCRLVCFVDDLDRCPKSVAKDVVEVLLAFSRTEGVSFLIACDRDVLISGVEDWMHQQGMDQDGVALVTANSALEKYIHFSIEMPDLSRELPAAQLSEIPAWVRRVLVGHPGLSRDAGPAPESLICADAFVHWLVCGADQTAQHRSGDTNTSDGAPMRPNADAEVVRESVLASGAARRTKSTEEQLAEWMGTPASDPTGVATREGANSRTTLAALPEDHQEVIAPAEGAQDSIKKDTNPFESENAQMEKSPVLDALAQLVVWTPEEPSRLWLRESHRRWIGLLSLRQLKYYIREAIVLLPEVDTPNQYDKQVAQRLLSQLFPPLAELKKYEPYLFRHLCSIARGLRESVESGQPGGWQLQVLYRHLMEVVRQSESVTEKDHMRFWPRKTEERQLLLHLLALSYPAGSGETDGVSPNTWVRASLPPIQTVARPVQPAESTSHAAPSRSAAAQGGPDRTRATVPVQPTHSPGEGEGRPPQPIAPDTEAPPTSPPLSLSEWARSRGLTAEGVDPAELLEEIADELVGQEGRFGNRVVGLTEALTQDYLPTLSGQLPPSAGVSLHNLALVMERRGALSLAAALFTEAMAAAPAEERIPLSYADALLDGLRDKKQSHLVGEDRLFTSEEQVLEYIHSLCTQALKDRALWSRADLYYLVWAALRKPSELHEDANDPFFGRFLELIAWYGADLISTSRMVSLEWGARLEDAVEAVFLKVRRTISLRSQLLAAAWRTLELAGVFTFPISIQIANLYAGEGATRGDHEKIGLGMNRALLLSEEATRQLDGRRIQEIWTQSGALLVRYQSNRLSRTRAMLCFLMGLVHSGIPALPSFWLRAKSSFPDVEEKDSRKFLEVLTNEVTKDPETAPLLEEFFRTKDQTTPLHKVVDYVFEAFDPIPNVQTLAKADRWEEATLQRVEEAAGRAAHASPPTQRLVERWERERGGGS